MFASQAKTKQQKDWLIPDKTITHMERKKEKKGKKKIMTHTNLKQNYC